MSGRQLPPIGPAAREILEILWKAGGPLRTRQVHDRVAIEYRRDRSIQATSSMLAVLDAGGWVASEKRASRRRWSAGVERVDGLDQLAALAVADFIGAGGDHLDAWHLVRAALTVAHGSGEEGVDHDRR